jgi:ribonuclease P protein component
VLRERITSLPAGSLLVVRAQAPSAGASYAELAADLDRCLARVTSGQETR